MKTTEEGNEGHKARTSGGLSAPPSAALRPPQFWKSLGNPDGQPFLGKRSNARPVVLITCNGLECVGLLEAVSGYASRAEATADCFASIETCYTTTGSGSTARSAIKVLWTSRPKSAKLPMPAAPTRCPSNRVKPTFVLSQRVIF